MECDQCGARRPKTGPCPNCGAPPPGTFSSMRQWKNQSRAGEGPAMRGSGSGWRQGQGWDEGGYEEPPAGRSGGRNRRNAPGYDEMDLDRALVPAQPDMLPMQMGMGTGMGVAIPGMPATDDEERAMGIRRPVYIPATGERKRKLGTWRVISGVLSVMLFCAASCAAAGVFGKGILANLGNNPISRTPTPLAFDLCGVPVTPVATPGPKSNYVKTVVTARNFDPVKKVPINPTSHFQVNDYVHVVATVRNIPKGESHTVSIRWFLQGQYLDLLGVSDDTQKTIKEDKLIDFALLYPAPGKGMAKVYFDRSDADKGDDPSDPTLAATIYFAVESPTPVPTPSKGTPSPGSPTPGSPTPASPTPGSPPPGSPRPGSPTPGSPPPGTPTPSPKTLGCAPAASAEGGGL